MSPACHTRIPTGAHPGIVTLLLRFRTLSRTQACPGATVCHGESQNLSNSCCLRVHSLWGLCQGNSLVSQRRRTSHTGVQGLLTLPSFRSSTVARRCCSQLWRGAWVHNSRIGGAGRGIKQLHDGARLTQKLGSKRCAAGCVATKLPLRGRLRVCWPELDRARSAAASR